MDGPEKGSSRTSGRNSSRTSGRRDRHRACSLRDAERRAPARRGRMRVFQLRGAERGSVTVEHAIGLVAVVGMIGLVVCAAQASITSTALCQAVRDGARAASIGGKDPQAVAAASFSAVSSAPASFAIAYDEEWVEVSGSATYRGPIGWAGGTATCSARTLVEGTAP
mgnify:FL=1